MSGVNWLYFDIETERASHEVGGWQNIQDLGLACAVTHSSAENSFRVYRKAQVGDLLEELRAADCVVGFNSIGFDVRVLQTFADFDLKTLRHLDLMLDIKAAAHFRVGLNNCCAATFGEKKSSNGLEALEWWRAGREQDVIDYCQQDVAITRRLHEWGATHGWIKCTDRSARVRTLNVPWTLSGVEAPPIQGSLF
ncbi:MAG TPA: ribonuclease H-like domain-containing protein [Abditibacteriaceae bacterium]|jgi:DEAD/DEAH box helicase domain-containing protein